MITYYKDIKTELNENIDFNLLINKLKDIKIKKITDNCRLYDKYTQKIEYREAQIKLPIVCFSAIFKEKSTHSIDNIIEHTNLLCLDYDGLDNTEDVFNLLKENAFIHFIYRSTSNKGLKVVVKINLDKLINLSSDMTIVEGNVEYNNVYKLVYDYIGEQFYNLINILPDPLAKDISRCSFISYDDKYHFNRNSQKFEITVKEAEAFNKRKLKKVKVSANKTTAVGTHEVAFMNEIIDFLTDKKLDITDNYNDWLYLAHLCKKLYEPKIAMIKFHQLSQFNPVYKPDDTTRKFNNILQIDKDKPTSFSYLNKLMKDNGISFTPKGKNLFKDKLDKEDVQRIMDYENWEIKYCKIKKIHYLHIPNLNHIAYPDNIIPIELSGKKGFPVIWQYFMKNYALDLTDADIDKNIYSYISKEFNFMEEKFEQIKTDDPKEYHRFFTLIESNVDIKSGMTRWFIGCFDNWLNDYGKKYDEMMILHDEKGYIGKTDLIMNYMFKIFTYNNRSYLCSNTNFNLDNKDAYMNDAQNLISYKAEISSSILKHSDQVKDYISRRETNLRVPYGRNMEEYNSYTSYIGDTNDENFLSAEQNRRRFIVVHLEKLHFQDAKFDWEKFWGYLYFLWKDKGYRYSDFTTIDNIDYVELNTDLSLLDEILSFDDTLSYNTTELISMIKMEVPSFRVSKNEMSKYLKMRGYIYKERWVSHIKKTKKGWNIKININNASEYIF